ncbi:TetR/AcrR family transcriptional regulator [Mycobacterium senriense]|uniref:TetR family transcriptional regulator n=1 Tax=Mycobacterium senriense TaxID=2775496 RepID=A0ABN6IDR6_9MYCO|nr:TetR/AcrR family transcriptional regulator [Mycobacterium senriense]BCZ21577.1 TetR family transcriptional regulator [Mycobacterium senriense]
MTVAGPQLGRPVGADAEQTRARIIAAAMRCVAEAGHTRATIREIARAADMTSASLYHYFVNKSELLEATVSEIDRIALPRLRDAAAGAENVVDRLAAVLDESSRLMRDYPDLAAFERAMGVIGHEHGNRTRRRGPKALRDTITEIISDARAQGVLPGGTEPRAAVNAIHALARGLTERAASLDPGAYAATLDSAKGLLRGTLFTDRRQ